MKLLYSMAKETELLVQGHNLSPDMWEDCLCVCLSVCMRMCDTRVAQAILFNIPWYIVFVAPLCLPVHPSVLNPRPQQKPINRALLGVPEK